MRAAILACFLLSGASSLVFELIWTRELTLVFGATIPAISTVLGVFMAGLALGSALGGRLSRRWKDLPTAYALAEAAIGLYALLVPVLLRGLPSVHAGAHALFGDRPALLSLTRLVATALILLPPTTLMGATLPLLSRHFVTRAGDGIKVGRAVGALYAWNTLGAVLGTFVGGFVLLPSIGKHGTNLGAAMVNLALATLVLLTRRRDDKDDALPSLAEPAPRAADSDEPTSLDADRVRMLVLASFAISGAVAMVCQVLWNRALAIVIGSSVYSFTLILLAFLIGLSGGAALLGALAARSRRPLRWLGSVHLAVGASVLASYAVMDHLPAAFLALLRGGSFTVEGIITYQFLLAALALLPPTLAMGGVLPITMRLVSRGRSEVGQDVGQAYALNTVGAILGSIAAGFVILPLVGLERGLRACAAASIGLGAVFLLLPKGRRLPRLVPALALLALVLVLPGWNLLRFTAGLFRVSIARQIIETDRWTLPQLAYYKDGVATTVSVEKWARTVALKNNGKVDASNGDDMATQIMVGLMPLIFHPTALDHPPRVAVIGYGSGVTIGAVTQFPIKSADVVELEPNVVTAGSEFFGTVNHAPEKDPRVHVVIDDGRSFLAASRKEEDRYDAIVSEPSNPWISGVSNLFTTDYWRIARARLKDNGVFCQWAQLYEMSPRNVKILLRSFSSVFPYTYVFAAEDLSSDVILVAANHPLELDLAHLRRNFAHPVLGAELRRGGVSSAEDLIAYLLLTPEELPAFTAGAPLNTDDNALIEYAAPRDLLGTFRYDPYLARVYGTDWPYGRFERHLVGLDQDPERSSVELALARALLAHGRRGQAARFLERARLHGAPPDSLTAKLFDALDLRRAREFEEPLAEPSDGDPLGLDSLDPPRLGPSAKPGDEQRLARDHLEMVRRARAGAYGHALIVLKEWPGYLLGEGGQDLALLVGMLLYKAELYGESIDRLKPLLDDPAYVARRPGLLYYLARAEYGDAIYDAAVRNMERFLRTRQQPSP